MFTAQEKAYLIAAIEMSIASNKRARNTSKNPQYNEMYDRVATELTQLLTKVTALQSTELTQIIAKATANKVQDK